MEVWSMALNEAANASGGNRAILVMDDEEMVRNLVAAMLEGLGYSAITCVNGEEAIACYANAKISGNPFLAVIMDLVVLNGMGGREAAMGILGIDPDARLIVSSGYSADLLMDSPERFGFRASLPKPYTMQDLASVLSEMLAKTPSCDM
jgi:two-component system, cell cycle sensor histidine kinase and response regulator CckA